MRLSVSLWWGVIVLLACGCALAGCAAPRPGGVAATRSWVTVDRARFRVDATPVEAVAYRLNPDLRLRRGAMVARGAVAIERATGCALRPGTLTGDVAVVRAGLVCPGGAKAPAAMPRAASGLHCQTVASRPVTGGGYDVDTLDCVVLR